jgi:PEP-CTERM motif
MRRVVLLALLALALPTMSWANSSNLVFTNTGGKMWTNGSTISLTGSTLSSFTALNGTTYTGNLGTVSFTTGSWMSGSFGTSAVLNGGGSFAIAGNGANGIPNGVLFTGSFSGPVTWVGTYNPLGNGGKGNWTYVLTGTLSGTLSNGASGFGGTVQLTFDVPGSRQFGRGIAVNLNNGITTVTVPEPGTLGLLGTGLIGIAGLVRRRLKK